MSVQSSQGPGPAAKRHGRNVSHNRIDLPRRNTRDPLQTGEDPLAASTPSSTADPVHHAPQSTEESITTSPPLPPIPTEPPRDLSFLLSPANFHSIPAQDVPPPFRRPPPSVSTSLSGLLSKGDFRGAAHLSAVRLVSSDPPSQTETFEYLYTRLVCLCLLNHVSLAAQESRILQDIGSNFWVTGHGGGEKGNILPWELRVLATRLQAIGVGDLRRAVPGYYDLAREARMEISTSKKNGSLEKVELWKARLTDLGVRVGNILVELGDLTGAARHLETLAASNVPEGEKSLIRGRIALLYLRIGRLSDARSLIVEEKAVGEGYAEILRPLLSVAEGTYSSAAKQLEVTSRDEFAVKNNHAIALVYSGEMKKGRQVLEELVQEGQSFPLLLFNLSTVFELCTERSKMLKTGLAENVAKMDGDIGGWEKSMQDFKLHS